MLRFAISWHGPEGIALHLSRPRHGNGGLAVSLTLPNLQALLCFTFLGQGANLDALGWVHLSNASTSYVF